MVLSKLNLLHLLPILYGHVYFSTAVYRETVIDGIKQGYPDAHILQRFLELQGWNATKTVRMHSDVAVLPLDLGERESISLAFELDGELLMDDERARSIARQLGLKVRGTLGVLVSAYRADYINAEQLRFYFEQIAERSDIWISATLCRQLLERTLNTDSKP